MTLQHVKRLEIVVEALQESAVQRLIADAGIGGYTLTRGVVGHGHRGDRDADDLTDVFRNVVFLVAAPPDAAEQLLIQLRPLLASSGGMCLVTDAQWLIH